MRRCKMVMLSRRILVYLISLMLVLSLLAGGCANKNPVYTANSQPSSPFNVTLSVNGAPLLDQPVQVTATFAWADAFAGFFDASKGVFASNTTLRIDLSEGLELVSGTPQWRGDTVPGTTYELKATIKTVKTGTWRITAGALYRPNKTDLWGGSAELYALVSSDNATWSKVVPHSPLPTIPGEKPPLPSVPPPSSRTLGTIRVMVSSGVGHYYEL
jgi:hypothetical protein